MRLFIALDLKELKSYFNEIQEQIPRDIAKIKPVSSFHLTLKFLGEIQDSEEIKSALKNIKFKPLKLKLTKELGFFPSKSYIKVVWIALKENKTLMQLQKDINQALIHIRDDFKFVPHLTLARVSFIKDREAFTKAIDNIKLKSKEITIKKFKIIKSELTSEGPIYEDLGVF